MKPFCTVCILLLFTQVSDLALLSSTRMALKCNLCVSKGNRNPCTPSVQTCLSHMTACGNIKFRAGLMASPPIHSCISMSACWSYRFAPNVTAVCCKTDLCN